MASSTLGSLSMTATLAPLSAEALMGPGLATWGAVAAATALPRGALTEKRVPCPGREHSSRGCPSVSAMRCTIDRPRPKPPMAGRSVALPRWNSSKMVSRSASPMPGPYSTPRCERAPRAAGRRDGCHPSRCTARRWPSGSGGLAQHQWYSKRRRDPSAARPARGSWRAPAVRYPRPPIETAHRAPPTGSPGVTTPASSLEMSRSVLIRSSMVAARARCAPRCVAAGGAGSARAAPKAGGVQRLQKVVAAAEEAGLRAVGVSRPPPSPPTAVVRWSARGAPSAPVSSSVRERTWPSSVIAVWNSE